MTFSGAQTEKCIIFSEAQEMKEEVSLRGGIVINLYRLTNYKQKQTTRL